MSGYVLSAEDQETVEKGEAARLLLVDPMFLTAIEAVRAQCAEGILTSPPSAKQEREDAYNLSRALSAVTAELDHMAAAGEQILAKADAMTEVTDQAFEPVEHPVDF